MISPIHFFHEARFCRLRTLSADESSMPLVAQLTDEVDAGSAWGWSLEMQEDLSVGIGRVVQ